MIPVHSLAILFNVSRSRGDRTSKGHVLGQPNTRPVAAIPERTMSPVVLSVVRLLMHSSMIMGACTDPAVCVMDIASTS